MSDELFFNKYDIFSVVQGQTATVKNACSRFRLIRS